MPRRIERWSEQWVEHAEWLRAFERAIVAAGAVVRRGGEFDRWDLEARGGVFAGARIITAVEEHGGGKQLVRARVRPVFSVPALLLALALCALAVGAGADEAVAAAIPIGLMALALGGRIIAEAASAVAVSAHVVDGGLGRFDQSEDTVPWGRD
jgi:hypothetical protein